jgi:hypothetical protein
MVAKVLHGWTLPIHGRPWIWSEPPPSAGGSQAAQILTGGRERGSWPGRSTRRLAAVLTGWQSSANPSNADPGRQQCQGAGKLRESFGELGIAEVDATLAHRFDPCMLHSGHSQAVVERATLYADGYFRRQG